MIFFLVDYRNLYDEVKKVKEKNERNKFNVFMNTVVSGSETDLNEAYQSDNKNEYEKIVDNVKKNGFRVFRNPDGKHKIVVGSR